MTYSPSKDSSDLSDIALKGTTYKVYRYILKQNRPVGISEVQKGLRLSSPSVSQYHIRKLLRLGMIREEQNGYVIDKMVLENIVRIRRVSIPIQTGYVAFFGVTLIAMLIFLRPAIISSLYLFSIIVNVAALTISTWEMRKSLRRLWV
jgi:predicted DNA-binding transcriptional regulator